MNATYGEAFILTLITDDSNLARIADQSGVNRIGVDLESLGKPNRQTGHRTRLSNHTVADLRRIGAAIDPSKVFVRVNPLHAGSRQEIDEVIDAGARFIMLPYFKSADELSRLVDCIDGRTHVIALVETAPAIVRIEEIVAIEGVHEIQLGLNDLRLGLEVHNHFEVLCSPVLDAIASTVLERGIAFAVGGVAPPYQHSLPIDPVLVLAQYPRLGATGAWISRSTFASDSDTRRLGEAVTQIRDTLTELSTLKREKLDGLRSELMQAAIGIRQKSIDI